MKTIISPRFRNIFNFINTSASTFIFFMNRNMSGIEAVQKKDLDTLAKMVKSMQAKAKPITVAGAKKRRSTSKAKKTAGAKKKTTKRRTK